MKRKTRTIVDFFRDREYYRQLIHLAVPIALQNLITSSLNMVALIFIGQLGEGAVASIGLGNQIWFLLNLIVFGICSGAAMFVAQLWGKNDIPNIRKVLGLTIKLSLVAAIFFWIVAVFFPTFALGIYTKDTNVIALGSNYLRIYGWSYLFFAMTAVFSTAARSTGNVRMPLVVSTSALALNVILAYPFIFGIKAIGLPAMGVEGAAIAGLIARILECMAILVSVYKDRLNPIAASIKDIFEFNIKFLVAVMKPVLPVILNETLWSFGITTYNVIYGHIGTMAVASVNILSTIEQLAFVIFLGLGTATSIMVGNQIGQGNNDKAYRYAGRSLLIQGTGAMLMGVVVYFIAGSIFQFYKVDPQVIADAKIMLIIFSCGLWMKASNHVIIIGILRSGGDTKFSLVLDGLVIWFIGVPVTAAGAFLLGWPIYYVYALTYTEEAVKFFVGVSRYFSKKWINDLTQKVENISLDA